MCIRDSGSTALIAIRVHPSMALVWLLASYVVIGIVESFFALVRPRPDNKSPETGNA